MLRERVGEDRAFYLSMGGVTALIIFLGFAPSYYLKGVLHAPPPLSALTSVHGAVFTGWVLLFLMQSALVGYGGAKLHRQLGVLGAVLFGGLVAVGLLTAVTAARLGTRHPARPSPWCSWRCRSSACWASPCW
ncbi:MAG: hypothetical protein GC201_14745 [Alphaproteobacteria bacterium]|nr:hypothetical protein [Alphaproteobacteria bacterium]